MIFVYPNEFCFPVLFEEELDFYRGKVDDTRMWEPMNVKKEDLFSEFDEEYIEATLRD